MHIWMLIKPPLNNSTQLEYIYGGKLRALNVYMKKDESLKTFSDINCSNIFFEQSPKAKQIKAKISKWDLIKFKSFCTTKEIHQKNEKTWGMGGSICK